jgi:hypothetical protein
MTVNKVPLQFTAIFLDPRDWRAAKELGKATKTSAGAVVREALSQHLARRKRQAAQQAK